MPSNLRSKPIEGYITDSAGNILRNSSISIKENTPNGSNTVDTVISDDNGYFITKPLPNGNYDIYESGIRITKTIHSPNQHTIQCYAVNYDNIPDNLPEYYQMGYTADNDINKFRHYIQIENDDIDIKQYGYSFPIYEPNLMINDLSYLSIFHVLGVNSRITSTRFDIEYFNPLTSASSSYKRIRWVGVPAIRFDADTKLVLPIDFYSIRINRPNTITNFTANIEFTFNDPLEVIGIYDPSDSDPEFKLLADHAVKGDIFKLQFDDLDTEIFYGIFVVEDAYNFHRRLLLKKWKSSNYISNPIAGDLENMNYVTQTIKYDGLFNGITSIGVSTNEKFTVTENIYAQDIDTELYNYRDV